MHAFLVYCPENSNVAENITVNLKKGGVDLSHDTRRLSDRMNEYKAFSANAGDPIILLISDNFLKDKACMFEALNFLQNPSLKNRIVPVIADGRTVDSRGKVNYSTTKFERVSNVIHYMNFWQDQYLELRKRKRDEQIENEDEFNQNLTIIRAISSEIGEFLRILRSTQYVEFDSFYDNKYEPFYRKAGWNNAFAQSRELELVPFLKEDVSEQEIDVDINSIPGIQMLSDKVQKEDVIKEEILEVLEEPPIETEKEQVLEAVTEVKDVIQTEKEETLDKAEELVEAVVEESSVEGSNLLNKVSDYKNNLKSDVADAMDEASDKIDEVVEDAVEETTDVVESVVTQEDTEVSDDLSNDERKEKEEFEKEGLSYQDKSSYDLLVSLFEDEPPANGDVQPTEDNNILKAVESEPNSVVNEVDLEEVIEEVIENEIATEEVIEEVTEKVAEETETEDHSAMIEEIKNDIVAIQDELENPSEEIQEPVEEEVVVNIYDSANIQTLLSQGDTLAAMKILKEVLTEQPENIDARYQYALVLSDQINNYSEAQEQLKTVISLAPDHIEAQLRLAELQELDQDFINAKHSYEKAIDANSDYPGLHFKYANLLYNQFRAQKKNAIKHYKVAVEQDENNIDALYQLAVAQYEFMGKPKKALKKFQKVIQMEPNHAFANYDIAVLYYELDKPKLAAQYYYDAYQNNPELRTDKNDEAFKVDKYLFAPQEEVLEEITIDDVSDLNGTYELTSEDQNAVAPNDKGITYEKIEELLEEEDTFEELEDESAVIESKTEEPIESVEDILDEITEEATEEIVEDDADDTPLELANNADITEEAETDVEETTEEAITDKTTEEGTEEQVEDKSGSEDDEEWELPGIPKEFVKPYVKKEREDEVVRETKGVIMITGATSGIGYATAQLFAFHGYDLIITGRRIKRLEELRENFRNTYDSDVEILCFDVRNADACQSAMERMGEKFQNIDILINNAGLARGLDPVHEGDIEHWDDMIDTNIKGLLYMTRLVSPGMVKRGKGHIVNIGSIAAKEVYPKGNVYCATKHAVDALTKGMRIDLVPHGIKVSAIHPGAVEETEFSMVRHGQDENKAKDYQDFTPVNARDIAETIHFIVTRPAHVNIQDLLIMGTQQASASIADKSGRKF